MSLSGNLFVADSLNNRIVVYSSLSGNSLIDTTPINVLGQSSFNTTLPGSGELELNQPGLITYDTKYDCLWVADVNNNRIMRYSNLLSQPMAKTNSSVDVLLSFSGRTPSVALAPKGKLHFFYSYANKCINKSKCRRTPTLSQHDNGVRCQWKLCPISFISSSRLFNFQCIDAQQTQNWQFKTTLLRYPIKKKKKIFINY